MNIEEILARLWLIVATSSSFETKDYPNCIVMKQDLKNLLTAYEKEKEKNKNLEQENSFLKMMYRGTDEFKAIENLAKEE